MTTIKLGNDDFILFIRKNQRQGGKASLTKNNQLGSDIWKFIRDNKIGAKVNEDSIPCQWNPIECNDEGFGLPKNATQFNIDTSKLKILYDKLYEISQA
jgi:hypothetical protein